MTRTIILACTLFTAISVTACSGEKYQPFPANIMCSADYGFSTDANGHASLRSVDKMACHIPPGTEDIAIELLSKDTPDGGIRTKDFGTIKTVLSMNSTGGTFKMEMKPSDASKLFKFLQDHQKP